jgi:hypothetical protein
MGWNVRHHHLLRGIDLHHFNGQTLMEWLIVVAVCYVVLMAIVKR